MTIAKRRSARLSRCVPPLHETLRIVADLVDGWCDRRCLRALRQILQAWPLASGLTDELGELLAALERVRAFAKQDLTDDDLVRVEQAIHQVGLLVVR